jgi:hypothetical protein
MTNDRSGRNRICDQIWRHDTQHDDIQHIDIYHKFAYHNDIQHENQKMRHSA